MKGWSNFSKISLSTIWNGRLFMLLSPSKKYYWKLTSDTLNLVSSNQYFFLDGFHGEYLPSNLMRYHVHFTIGSSAYCFKDLEVTLGYTCLYRWRLYEIHKKVECLFIIIKRRRVGEFEIKLDSIEVFIDWSHCSLNTPIKLGLRLKRYKAIPVLTTTSFMLSAWSNTTRACVFLATDVSFLALAIGNSTLPSRCFAIVYARFTLTHCLFNIFFY